MAYRDVIQYINLILALAAIFPSFFILRKLWEERKIVDVENKRLNKALTAIFAGITLGEIINAILALLVIFNFGLLAHNFSPIRGLIINTFFSIASWFIYFVNKEIERS